LNLTLLKNQKLKAMKQPELGLRILELRKQKGLTQDELVDFCNINVRTLQRIENGEVTPRSYTIKTILTALDYDYESLQAEQEDSAPAEMIAVSKKDAKSVHTLLTMSWIAGIIFIIVAVFEGVADYVRMSDGELIYGQWGHLLVKVLVLTFNVFLLYGFLISGKLLRNYLMKIATILMMIALLCFYAYDIASVFMDSLQVEVVFMAESVTFGALGVLFGISIVKSRTILGNTGLASGITEILMAFCLLTVILAPVALFFFLPAALLEILVLYKVSTMVGKQL
jgi:transcriptional regulator with XRE-family HTH domain